MTQIAYRATLSNAMWPQSARKQARTVVSPAYESLSSRKADLPSSEERDIISPQVYYVENCMPTNYGFDSVGFHYVLPRAQLTNLNEQFLHITKAAAVGASQILIGVTNYGEIWLLPYAATQWKKAAVSSVHPLSDSYNITSAVVNNRLIVHIKGVNRYEYDYVNGELVPVTFLGLETTPLSGIFSTTNYLGAWDDDTVYWGAFENPTDFVPSEITGAGNGVVQAAKGKITACVPTTLGFIIYCENNAISALATARADEPFTLREITASGGVIDIRQLAIDWNSILQYAWTTSGLQQVTNTDAKAFLAEFTDLIEGQQIDYVGGDGQISVENWPTGADVRVAVVKDRFLCISYKRKEATYFQWCLVYDIYLKRLGKLRRDHIQIIDYFSNIGVVRADGNIEVVRQGGSGIIALGKYQHIRQRMLALDSVEVENYTGNLSVVLASSLNGDSISSIIGGFFNPDTNKFNFNQVGINHRIVLTGNFTLNSVILHYHVHGRA